MSREAFDAIKAGLEDALAYARGNKGKGRAHRATLRPIAVKTTRKNLELSQSEFAELFGVSVATVRNWEQGRRQPEGPARVLLHVIKREPEAVLRALHSPNRRSKTAKKKAG